MDDGSELTSVADIKKFVIECFTTIGVSKVYSEIMAETIVGADVVGHVSHGVYRLDKFLDDVENGCVYVQGSPKIEKETSATAWVDGQNMLGPIVGNFCMKLAIEKAKETGAAIVVVNNSNNFGVSSHYSKQALKEGLIGLAFTNSSSLMLPTRAKYPISGTNPISLAAPGLSGDFFLLDMATTVTSGGNIQMKYENGEYLPVGWAVNAACISETNADVALNTGRFLPLGSNEESSSYKGTGLSIMIDILCGILGGAAYSTKVGIWSTFFTKKKANVGQCFIAINPDHFAPGFEGRMSKFMSSIRNVKPVNPSNPVRVAGDKVRSMAETIKQSGGIRYPKSVVDTLKKLSKKFKLKCVSFVQKSKSLDVSLEDELAHSEVDERMSVHSELVKFTASEEISLKEYPVREKEISFIVEDSSEWLCPFTNPDENLRRKKERLLSMIAEKGSRPSTILQSITVNNNSFYTDADEIVETQMMNDY